MFRVIFIKRAYTRESNRTDVSRRHTSISQVIMAARTRPIPSTNRNKTYYYLVPALIDAVCCAVFLSFIGIYLRRRLFIFIFRENWVVSDHCVVLLGFLLIKLAYVKRAHRECSSITCSLTKGSVPPKDAYFSNIIQNISLI